MSRDVSRMSRKPRTLTSRTNRIRASSPGIIAAIVLTVAALGFLAAAFFGGKNTEPVSNVAPKSDLRQSAAPNLIRYLRH